MASRAESISRRLVDPLGGSPELPAAPRLRRAIRAALSDFYFNSLRLVAANLVWTGVLVGLYLLFLVWPFGAIVLSPILALPTAGIFRLAVRIVRGEMASFGDALEAWRRFGRRALALGAAVIGGAAVLVINVVTGLADGGLVGWSLATLAFWGLAVGATLTTVAWPILVDPRRESLAARDAFRLAALLVLAFPLRFGALTAVVVVFVLVSVAAVAAVATVSISLAALVTARYVLPASDRFEAQLAGTTERARARS